MKKDIKNEIISAARELFSINGYNAVTMRDVADALGISVGNLTYHFKKKEDLIEAVIIDQHRGYRKHGEIKTLAAVSYTHLVFQLQAKSLPEGFIAFAVVFEHLFKLALYLLFKVGCNGAQLSCLL